MKKLKFTIARRLIIFTVARLHADPAFFADLEAAKAEIAALRTRK